MAAAEEGQEPLHYQALALKVNIHCEGCKKKVKKVLKSMEGVYKTDIDIQQQKVVVIGNVSMDALVKKLVKTGKHAEPWPEPAPPPSAANPPGSGKKKKKKSRNKNPGANNKPAEPALPSAATAEGCPPEKQDQPAGSCDEASDDEPEGGAGGGAGGGSATKLGAGDVHEGGAGMVAPLAMTPHGQQPITPTANVSGSGGGGGGKKKKKSKKGAGNGNANTNGDGTGATMEASPHDSATNPAVGNAGPQAATIDAGFYPPPTAMSYPAGYYAGGMHMPPPYAMSYSTAHPLRSSAYYHPMVGATYTGGGGGGHFYSTAPASAAPGSYYMFSEENANACRVM